jgi:archaeosine synthase beta-subunit
VRGGCTGRPTIGRTSIRSTLNAPSAAYPETAGERDRWIQSLRGSRRTLDPRRAYGAFVEEEATEAGGVATVATLLLTNRECPWRCLMCDLWKNTLEEDTRDGAVTAQITTALSELPPARRIKLYNAGSFFDPRAIPRAEDAEIAELLAGFDRVVVESHPSFVGERCFEFAERLGAGRLEVAMGLETVQPEVLARINKGMTLASFRASADRLASRGVGLRAFVLAGLPWVKAREQRRWTVAALEFAFDCGARAVSIIPTRTGNGAMDSLAASGEFAPPDVSLLEGALADGLRLGRGLVFADLWDLGTFSTCEKCFGPRATRLASMNRSQTVAPVVACDRCKGAPS